MRRGRFRPRQEWILLLICAIFALGCVRSISAPEVPKEIAEKRPAIPPHVLIDVRLGDNEVRLQLKRSGTRDINYTGFKEIDPLRLVVDLYNTIRKTVSSSMAVEGEIIDEIRAVEFIHESQPVTRVEIGLKRDTAYIIDQGQAELWVKFYTDPQMIEAAAALGELVVDTKDEDQLLESDATQEADISRTNVEERLSETQPGVKESLSPASTILEIQPVVEDKTVDFEIIGDGRFDNYSVFVLTNPPRIVLDVFGIRSTKVRDPLILDGPWVKRIRMGRHPDKMRVVFDLIASPEGEVPYRIILTKDRLIVSFQPGFDWTSR